MDSPRSYVIIGLIAAIVGLAAGLGYAWFAAPVEYTDVSPAELRAEYRPTWITLVAASYAVENDWGRANFRLEALGEKNIGQSVADVMSRAMAEMQPTSILRALARLAEQLGVRTPEMIIYLATPLPTSTPNSPTDTPTPPLPPSPTPTFVPLATLTPLPTLTPTPTPLPSYLLVSQDRQCETGASAPQIQAIVQDNQNQGIPGVDVWVNWDGGADRFVTGLKPELGAGYGDFDLTLGLTYNVSVGNSAVPLVSGLKAEVCPSNVPTQTAYTMWRLIFQTIAPTLSSTATITSTSPITITPTLAP